MVSYQGMLLIALVSRYFSTLLFRNKMYGIVIFIWAIIMSYSRIYLGVHFVSDIAGGIISGIILGGCVYGLYYFVTKRIAERSPVVYGSGISLLSGK